MDNLINCDGRKYSATIDGTTVRGEILVDDDNVFLLQNDRNGCKPTKNLRNYSCAWLVHTGSSVDLLNNSVTDLKLEAIDLETYKDFKKGDALTCKGERPLQVVEVSGDIVFVRRTGLSYITYGLKSDIYRRGYRLKIDSPKKEEVKEITMDEIADKFGIPVDKLKIKKS